MFSPIVSFIFSSFCAIALQGCSFVDVYIIPQKSRETNNAFGEKNYHFVLYSPVQIYPKSLYIPGFFRTQDFLRCPPPSQIRSSPQNRLLLGRRKKPFSCVRVRTQHRKGQKGSMKFRKNSGSKKREKSLEISRFPAARITKRLFPPRGSKLTCHHVMCVRFRCKAVCGQFRCTQILQRGH